MNKALILIDFENEWIDPKSDYFVGNIDPIIKNTNQLINYCRNNNYKIIFIRHVEKDSEAFKENSKNTEIISTINKQSSDVLITKYKISSFYNTNLEKELKNIKEIVVCGILTNLCVRMFLEEAYDRDFNLTLVENCCTSFDKKTHQFTLDDLKKTREEITIFKLKEFIKFN